MKKISLFIGILLLSVSVWAQSFPVSLPTVGNGRLRVCGQNLYNYFVVDLSADRCKYHDRAGLEAKTRKIVQSFLYIDADIYSLCELEVNDSTLSYLTEAMNTQAGARIYKYVRSGLSADNTQVMSGFIYRSDRVQPVGNTLQMSTQTYYKRTMRMQTFEELSTGEKFGLSMNHFKAKDSTADQGEAKREKNAQDLISALGRYTADPDVLVLGDLNETTTEPAVSYIIEHGYTEMLEYYHSNAYSYRYQGQNQLIDHALANESMQEQITGAAVFHINTGTTGTSNSSRYWYSDHDPYIVAINLGGEIHPNSSLSGETESSTHAVKRLIDGRLLIIVGENTYTITGQRL